MKKFLLVLLFAVSSLRAVVVDLNDKEFDAAVLSSPIPVIVKLYTPRCGACIDFKQPFILASNMLSQYKFVELDIVKNSRIRERYQVRGVPSVLFFWKGKLIYRHTGSMSVKQLSELTKQYFSA